MWHVINEKFPLRLSGANKQVEGEKKMVEKEVIIEDGKVVKETKRSILSKEAVKGGVTFGTCLPW